MEEQERLVKGIWIPIDVWKNKELNWNEKVLLVEIDSFSSNEKDCFVSNQYISELLGINETNASKTLSSLVEKGYVIRTRFDGKHRYVKSALSQSTTLPCRNRQPSRAHVSNTNINNNNNILFNKPTNKEENSKKETLFEECWIAYNRKGSKKKAKEQWNKLTIEESNKVLQHIKVYVSSRERQYQKDFERYLRDKTFNDIVSKGNTVIYDPTRGLTNEYHPATDGDLRWDEKTKSHLFVGMFFGTVYDGYTNDNRPNGATVVLNNAQGAIVWNSNTKQWEKKQ